MEAGAPHRIEVCTYVTVLLCVFENELAVVLVKGITDTGYVQKLHFGNKMNRTILFVDY